MTKERETFGSRLGFILVAAGCAVGLGNVWKFPYMCGQYGGAIFILFYLLFLAIMGLPIIICEFGVGRGSGKSCATSFKVLEPKGRIWHRFGYFGMAGNYLLLMFYSMVAGWMLYYCYRYASGEFANQVITQELAGGNFSQMTGSAGTMTLWTFIAIGVSAIICSLGVQKGVEKVSKVLMIGLLALIVVLAVNSSLLPNAVEGLKFYLVPNLDAVREHGLGTIIFGAMSQSFFTLSIGMGGQAIFGSYMKKDRTLTGEAINVLILDTFVALMAGLIIIPACFSFNLEPNAGPPLIFITLPHIFGQMPGGSIWGALFFLFLSFAAITTVIGVLENIIAFAMDLWGWSRKKATIFNVIALTVLSLPCILGWNILSNIQPLGDGTNIMDLEDFLVSYNILPLGSMVYLMFCTSKNGWGWQNFIAEANTGKGLKFPQKVKGYMTFILPIIVVAVYLKGYWDMFVPRGTFYLISWMIIAVLFLAVIAWFAFGKKRNVQ